MSHRHRLFLAAALAVMLGVQAQADEATDQFNFATGLLIRNEYALAADEFQKLLQKHPAFPQADVALYRLGEALEKGGQTAPAQAAFERLVKEHPKSERAAQASYWLAQIAARQDPRAAAVHYAAVFQRWPESPLAEAARYGQAEELFKAEAWPAAAQACAELLQAFPEGKYVAQARYSRAWALAKAGDDAAALTAFQEFVQRHPDHELAPECRIQTAACLRRLKKLDEALAAYEALRNTPGAVGLDARVGRAFVLYERQEMPAAAAAFLEAAQALGPDARAPVCLLNAGHAFMAAEQFEPAAAALATLTTDWPTHESAATAAYWHGYALVRLGRFDEAAPILTKVVADPQAAALAVESRLALAEALAGRQEHVAAAALYAEAARQKADHPLADDAAAGQVFALEQAGDIAAAAAAAEAFVKTYPKSDLLPTLLFAAAEYRFRLQQYPAGGAAFAAFVAACPEHALVPDAHYKLGWCARHLKEQPKAQEHFAQVAAKYPQSPLAAESAFRAGQAGEALGDAAAAAKSYAEAVRLGGDGVFAQQAELALVALELSARESEPALKRALALGARFPKSEFLPFAHLYAGEALVELGRPEEALTAYRRVDGAHAVAAADAAFGIGWACRQLERHDEAIAAFTPLAEGQSSRAEEAAWWLARTLEDAARFADAGARYAVFATRFAESIRLEEAEYRRALCAYRAREWAQAEQLYAALLAARPQGAFAAQALYDRAWVQLEQNHAPQGEAHFRQLVDAYPASPLVPDARFRLGELAYDRQQYAEAAAAYEAALAVPKLAFADKLLYKLGWAREHLEQPEPALQAFDRLVRETATSELVPEARYRCGRLLQQLGRRDEAIAALAQVPDGAFAERARFLVGESQRAAGRHKEALAAYDDVLKRWPEGDCRVPALLGRGHSLRASGANQDALEAYAAVVAATEAVEAAQAVLGQGYAHLALNQYAEAAKAFLKVDILYGYDELKPEALAMLVKTWTQAGDAAKAAQVRDELRKRYPDAPTTQEP